MKAQILTGRETYVRCHLASAAMIWCERVMESAVGTYGTVRQELYGAEGCGHMEPSITNKLEASIWYRKWRYSTSCFRFPYCHVGALILVQCSVRRKHVAWKVRSYFCSTTIQYVIYIYMKHLGVRGKEQRNLESKRVRINFLPKIKVGLHHFLSTLPCWIYLFIFFQLLTRRVFLVWIFAEEQQAGERSRRKGEEASIQYPGASASAKPHWNDSR